MSLLVPMKRSNVFPWAGFGELEQQLERLISPSTVPGEVQSATWMPPVDIHESEDAYTLVADLPGMKKEDISVNIVEDRVTLKGSRKREERHEEKGYRRFERAEGTFQRSFRINGGVDASKVEATFENGVLTVKLPKPEEAKPREIEVKVG
jgi:HSP20 family protein